MLRSKFGVVRFLSVALVLGAYGTFVLNWGLVMNVAVVVPAATAAFLLSGLVSQKAEAHVVARDALFLRLDTPVDVSREVPAGPDPTAQVFRFLGRAIAVVGLVSLAALGEAAGAERVVVLAYAALTLALAGGLALVRGSRSRSAAAANRPA